MIIYSKDLFLLCSLILLKVELSSLYVTCKFYIGILSKLQNSCIWNFRLVFQRTWKNTSTHICVLKINKQKILNNTI